jgi:hypothetical protein
VVVVGKQGLLLFSTYHCAAFLQWAGVCCWAVCLMKLNLPSVHDSNMRQGCLCRSCITSGCQQVPGRLWEILAQDKQQHCSPQNTAVHNGPCQESIRTTRVSSWHVLGRDVHQLHNISTD